MAILVKSEKKKRHIYKLAIVKNPYSLSYAHETWWKESPHEWGYHFHQVLWG